MAEGEPTTTAPRVSKDDQALQQPQDAVRMEKMGVKGDGQAGSTAAPAAAAVVMGKGGAIAILLVVL